MAEVETVSNGETQVTFVAGKAAEQTTSGESATPEAERSAAIEAVREALRKEGEEAAAEAKESIRKSRARSGFTEDADADGDKSDRGPDGRFQKAAQEPEKAENELSVKRVLAERKQVAQYKQQQSQAIQEQLNQLNQIRAEIAREREEAKRERAYLAELRKDPARVIREIGYDPEEFIMDLAKEGTPEGQAMRKQREYERQLKEMNDWRRQQEEARVQAQQRYEEQKAQAYRQHVEREFVSLATNQEKYPHLAAFYGKGMERMLVAQGDIIADNYRELTGQDASFEDIADYLESEISQRYSSVAGSRQASAAQTRGRPSQGATGRTLSSKDTSERRALGQSLKDLDGDERLAAAREAVGAALRASGEKT